MKGFAPLRHFVGTDQQTPESERVAVAKDTRRCIDLGRSFRPHAGHVVVEDIDASVVRVPFARDPCGSRAERAILDVLEQTKAAGRTLVVVHHDLATAEEYFDSLVLLKQRLYAFGPPETVLHRELLSDVYEGTLRVFADLSEKEDSKR